jgi:hypothetical protein
MHCPVVLVALGSLKILYAGCARPMLRLDTKNHELQRPSAGCWLQFTVQSCSCFVESQRLLESGLTGPGIEVGSSFTTSPAQCNGPSLIRWRLLQCILRN